ncbi:DivIVA domain-containing protein [Rhodoflexus sp.]
MKVTPLDIRKKSFERVAFGGYSKEEVHSFLNILSQIWEDYVVRNNDLETRLSNALSELNRLRDLESSFVKHLNKLEDSNNALRENSKKEAELLMYETRIKANQILEDARIKARAMIKETNQRAYQTLSDMREELRKLDYACRMLEQQRDLLLRDMRQLLADTQEKIDRMEANKRTVIYEEEIRKANELMRQQNAKVKQDLKEINELAQTPQMPPIQPQTNNYVTAQEQQPIATADDTGRSFFDTL